LLELVAAVSAASTAFNTIKKMVATGREIHDVGTQIAEWYGHIADATEGIREANDPPLHKKLLGNPEQMAVQALVQKKKVEEQRKQLRELIMVVYGKDAWLELRQMEKDIRKAKEKAEYASRRRAEKFKAAIVAAVILAVGISVIFGTVFLFF